MTSLIAPVEILRQRPAAWWAVVPIGRRADGLVWIVRCVSCGKLRCCVSSNIGPMKRCKECGSHRGMLEREAMWHRNTGSAPVDFWFRDTDYGYDSTRLAVAESELMMGSVAAWYTEADAEACENWEPTSVTDDKRQRVTKMARKKMSASAKLRWAKRRQAQAAE